MMVFQWKLKIWFFDDVIRRHVTSSGSPGQFFFQNFPLTILGKVRKFGNPSMCILVGVYHNIVLPPNLSRVKPISEFEEINFEAPR